MLFGKKKRIVEEPTYNKKTSPADIYLANVSNYLEYLGEKLGVENPNQNKEFYETWGSEYYNAAMYFVKYLENNYTNEMFENNSDVQLDVEDMIKGMTDEAKLFFGSPKYPDLVYIDEGKYATHFHLIENKVSDAEWVEVLPGLSRVLANEKINRLFCNLTIPEVRALLAQMNILPKNNELDQVIEDVKKRERINRSFLETILSLILIQREKYTLERARIFAEAFGINFEIEPLSFEHKGQTLKKI